MSRGLFRGSCGADHQDGQQLSVALASPVQNASLLQLFLAAVQRASSRAASQSSALGMLSRLDFLAGTWLTLPFCAALCVGARPVNLDA